MPVHTPTQRNCSRPLVLPEPLTAATGATAASMPVHTPTQRNCSRPPTETTMALSSVGRRVGTVAVEDIASGEGTVSWNTCRTEATSLVVLVSETVILTGSSCRQPEEGQGVGILELTLNQ